MLTLAQATREINNVAKEIAALQRASYEGDFMAYAFDKIKSSTQNRQSPTGKAWAQKLDGTPAGVWVQPTIYLTARAVRSSAPHAIFFHSRRKLTKSKIGIKFGKKYSVKRVSVRVKVGGSRPIMPGFHIPRSWDMYKPFKKTMRNAFKQAKKYIEGLA